MQRGDIPLELYREMHIQWRCKHENMVTLHSVVKNDKKCSWFLIMEFIHWDMYCFLHSLSTASSASEVRSLMRDLVTDLGYLHSKHIMHRDLKPSNLFLTDDGALKISDFGLALEEINENTPSEERFLSPKAFTRWYRPPEYLTRVNDNYNCSVDIWSVGCILAEFISRKVLFRGENETHPST